MSIALVTNKAVQMPRVWSDTWDHAGVQSHAAARTILIWWPVLPLGPWWHRDWNTAMGHVSVHGPAAAGVCIDVHDPCYLRGHRNHSCWCSRAELSRSHPSQAWENLLHPSGYSCLPTLQLLPLLPNLQPLSTVMYLTWAAHWSWPCWREEPVRAWEL